MKDFLFALVLISSTHAFAAAQLVCSSEDGSQVQATVSDSNEVSQIRVQLREGKLESTEGARAALIDVQREKVKSLVIADLDGKILVAVASGVYVDRTGAYSLSQCEISY